MLDNPIYKFSKKNIKKYHKLLFMQGKRTRLILSKYIPNSHNQHFIRKWLFNIADSIKKETQRFLVTSIEEVIEKTIHTYNDLHKGKKLSDYEIAELKTRIYKEFLLTKFKGKTLDQRISHSNKRLKVNLQRELQTFVNGYENGSRVSVNTIINSITGKDYTEGGTALRWNSRLILSEMFRAYQFTTKAVLIELGVREVSWVNSPRHTPGGKLIDEYAEKTYNPRNLPEYPYPCNDSYIIPIYKD